ncbi:MAG: hypothetical protein ACSHXB_13020 [Sulfitobacter sp.]
MEICIALVSKTQGNWFVGAGLILTAFMETESDPTFEVKISVRGRFMVRNKASRDITPRFRKERAILALLAVSSEKRCSRSWLQSKLWSEKTPEKASANLRRALANLREALGEHSCILGSNRLELWLEKTVHVDWLMAQKDRLSLLELVEAPDPAFDDWLRDLRAEDEAKSELDRNRQAPLAVATTNNTVIVISVKEREGSDEARFVELMLTDALAGRFRSEGAEEIYTNSAPALDQLNRAATVIYIEVSSLVDEGWWNVHLRALADQDRRFLWSGRLRVPMNVSALSEGSEIQGFVSQVMSQVLLRFQSFRLANKSKFIRMHKAASSLYISDLKRINHAEGQLTELSEGEGMAVALAWRSFACLARKMEFPSQTQGAAAESEILISEALAKDPANPLVNAIAARIAIDLNGDIHKAQFFSSQAMAGDEKNPYALQAASRVALQKGHFKNAATLAEQAQNAAQGLPHKFAWDMEVCLTSLASGDMERAGEAASAAHLNNTQHRAALRYLIAIKLLAKDFELANKFAKRLRFFEPGFQFTDLGREDYPVLTLRKTGYASEI